MIHPLRLANEWRDSLLVTTLIVISAATWSVLVADLCVTIFIFRQIARDTQWSFMPPRAIVGGPSIPHPRDVADWGGLSAGFIGVTGAALFSHSTFTAGLWLFVFVLNSTRALLLYRSLRPIWTAGLATWDWPRKRGGPTETQKLYDWAASFGQRFQPAAGAA